MKLKLAGKYLIAVLHVTVAAFFSLYFFSDVNISEPNSFGKIIEDILIIILFYFHALILVPNLLKYRKINHYIFLTFGMFAISAVIFSILSVAARNDYIYVFSLIRYKGIAYNEHMVYLYREKYFLALSLFGISFVYGFLISRIKNKLEYLGNLIFSMKSTEFLLHVTLLIVLFIASYFLEFFFETLMIASLVLFYSHLLFTSPFLFKAKRLNIFMLVTLLETIIFGVLITTNISMQFGVSVSVGVTIITLATIYSFIKHQFREHEFLFTKKEIELNQLKSQINPHFLFNSLNTLYGLAIKEEAEETASSIKKLSKLIRFTLRDLSEDYIALEKEISYIKDYIDIQLVRCPVKQDVETNFSNFEGHQIAPMLLIPFVENAFKHGINPVKESTLKINLNCSSGTIYFECINSKKEKSRDNIVEEGFGIGIDNVRSRLSLIYPGQHNLKISDENNRFTVRLEIYDKSSNN